MSGCAYLALGKSKDLSDNKIIPVVKDTENPGWKEHVFYVYANENTADELYFHFGLGKDSGDKAKGYILVDDLKIEETDDTTQTVCSSFLRLLQRHGSVSGTVFLGERRGPALSRDDIHGCVGGPGCPASSFHDSSGRAMRVGRRREETRHRALFLTVQERFPVRGGMQEHISGDVCGQ